MGRIQSRMFGRLAHYGHYGWIAWLLSGCGNPGSGTIGSNGSAIVQGQVKRSGQGAASGSTVKAYRVENDGRLTQVDTGAVQVDAASHYRLSVNVTVGVDEQLVVTAMQGSTRIGSATIEGTFGDGATIQAAPIDSRSTVETDLVVSARAQGDWSATATLGELRGLITDELAGSIAAVESDQATLQACAKAAAAAMATWEAMLTAQGMTQGQHDAALQAIATASARLDASLAAATSAGDERAALTSYFAAFEKAHIDAGLTIEQMAQAGIATTDTVRAFVLQFSTDARAELIAQVQVVRAELVARALAAELAILGASDGAKQAIAQAGTTLQAQLAASASAGAAASAEVTQAWAQYQAVVSAQLAAVLALPGPVAAELTAAIESDLQALATARAGLSASAQASATAQAEATALGQFFASGISHKSMMTIAGVSDVNATAFLKALLILDSAASNN